MTRPLDQVRSFGMSGMLITDEIRALEKRFGLELGHGDAERPNRSASYIRNSSKRFGLRRAQWRLITSCSTV